MSAVLEQLNPHIHTQERIPVVVVGTGPVGIRFVEELLQHDPCVPIVIYGNEPWEPYNRVRLTSLLTGELNLAGIHNPINLKTNNHVLQHHNCEIVDIDRDNKQVLDSQGNRQSYSHLVLATGSRPHIPKIPGIDKSGIYTFRNLDDTQKLMARRTRSRNVVVLGGGLLGLEAARGLHKYNTNVTIVEHASRLMSQQLDDEAASLLREYMYSQNIQVVLGDSVKQVQGDDWISGVMLRSGRTIECDTMVISTGIRSNIELARDGGISVGNGIRVNDHMQTNDPTIFAIGECAEHRERVHGLVGPGFEQAGVAAYTIAGGTSYYSGSQAATRLKVAGVSVFSSGFVTDSCPLPGLSSVTWRSCNNAQYRKLFLKRNRLIGVIAYGEWEQSRRVQETVQGSGFVWPWQRRRFERTGDLWSEQETGNVASWPSGTIVCQCANVKRGVLSSAVLAGHRTMDALCQQTGAASVCGSCKPLLAELLGGSTIAPEQGYRTLVWMGLITLLTALVMFFAPAIPFPKSVQVSISWDMLWRDSLIKQISGFSLLGLGVLISIISLRKRLRWIRVGDFSVWRVLHVVIGVLAVIVLVTHTGLRLGHELNLYLMLSFIGLLLAGGISSSTIGLQHVLPRAIAKQSRDVSMWLHILLLWPLPALISFHVLKTYWF